MDTSSTPEANIESSGDPIVDRLMDRLGGGEEPQQDATAPDDAEEHQDSPDDDLESEDSDEQPEDSTEEDQAEEEETLASLLGVDEDQIAVGEDGRVTVTTKVDGETAQVSLPELVKGYQLNKAITQRSQALAEERKAFEQTKGELAQQLQAEVDKASNLANYLMSQALQEYQGVNWEELRQIDPAEYVAKRHDAERKQQELNQVMDYAKQMQQQQYQQQHQEHIQQLQNQLREQFDVMLNNNPQWRDTEQYKRDITAIKTFTTDAYGFSEDELDAVVDARIIEVLKDAKAYREGQKVAEKKRVATPKFIKPGKPRVEAKANTKRQQKAVIRRNGGSLNDIAAYLESNVL